MRKYVCFKIMLNKQDKITHILGNAITSSVLNGNFFYEERSYSYYVYIKRKNDKCK